MDVEKFQSRPVRIEVSKVNGITVPEPGGIEQLPVVVHSTGSPDDFITSVTIDIGHGEVVIAIAIHGATTAAGSACSISLRGFAPIGIIKVHFGLACACM